MLIMKEFAVVTGAISVVGCAGIDFGEQGLAYYEPEPYVLVANNKDCTQTVTPMAIPGKKTSLKFKSGLGSADLSVSLSNGMITNVGQKTDTKIPETVTALLPAISLLAPGRTLDAQTQGKPAVKIECEVESTLYRASEVGEKLSLPPPNPVIGVGPNR